MPIYEYQCAKCGKTFEFMQSFSEAPKKKCEKCGGKLSKLISAAGFILKGGGWYKDLYASTKPGDSSKGSDDGGDSSSSKGESKGESKSDSKGESKSDSKAEKPSKSEKPDKKSPKKKASA